ncbi:hypothetical protein M011DRAFT_114516 [Sporormia fimetaria CBS 119925]|uniref:Uncharacterized protein n=1 Tax=Sporormia fimetaria CBS 119925 TaxID=1340428 RepID=A0A6A6VNX9_9PLEO|nr:hypothetical protein M011DRAFT_114516 [Sporormia fimetaria CBS 119925]
MAVLLPSSIICCTCMPCEHVGLSYQFLSSAPSSDAAPPRTLCSRNPVSGTASGHSPVSRRTKMQRNWQKADSVGHRRVKLTGFFLVSNRSNGRRRRVVNPQQRTNLHIARPHTGA